jgi:hypothetical protein
MCQAKPGPRCSSDTRAAMYSTYEVYTAVKEQAEPVIDREVYAQDAYDNNPNATTSEALTVAKQQAAAAKQRLNSVEKEYNAALYSYYASPDGLTHLEHKVKETEGKRVRVQDGAMTDDGDWATVQFVEQANLSDTFLLNNAQAHRTWQTAMLKKLNGSTFSNDRRLPLSLAGSEREKIVGYMQNVQQQLNLARANYAMGIERCISTRNEKAEINNLRASKREIENYTQYLNFMRIRVSDLHSYEKDYIKKNPTALIA